MKLYRLLCLVIDKLCNNKYFLDDDKSSNNKIYLLLETNLFFFESWSKYLNIFLQKRMKTDFGLNEEIDETYLSSTDDENKRKKSSQFILKFADGFIYDQTLNFKPSYTENIYINIPKKQKILRKGEDKLDSAIDDNYGKFKKSMKTKVMKTHPYWKMVNYIGYEETYWNILNRITEKSLKNLNSMTLI